MNPIQSYITQTPQPAIIQIADDMFVMKENVSAERHSYF